MNACKKCGEVHTRCKGHKHGMTPCMRWPGKYKDHCKKHEGSPAARAKADERAEMLKARDQLRILGSPVEHNPAQGILDEIFWSKGHIEFYRSRLGDLPDADLLVWGESQKKLSTDGFESIEKAGTNVWLKLYVDERRLYLELVERAHRMGIEERQIELAEALGSQLVSTMKILTENIRVRLVRYGWLEEELNEVWTDMIAEAIPDSIRMLGSRDVVDAESESD